VTLRVRFLTEPALSESEGFGMTRAKGSE